MNTLGERILYLITKNNMSKAQLAQIIHKSKPMITKYVNNDSEPTSSVLKDIAETFNVTLDYLVMGKNEYKDSMEKQLLETYRELNHDNKVEIVGETTKLLIKQRLDKGSGNVER